jgi:hypothetical protein
VLSLIPAVEDLYRRAVLCAPDVDDEELARWIDDMASTFESRPDRQVGRAIRRAARNGGRIARYWRSGDRRPDRLPDWRNGVDEVLGGRGWQPHLDLARRELESAPSPEAFQAVKRWFRAVHFTPWMEGVSFEQWLEARES